MIELKKAQQLLLTGEVIAYPTEAVYGLGCDPFNEIAVQRLLSLKGRSGTKGFILLIAEWFQLWPLIDKLPNSFLKPVQDTWPGAVTWIFPKSNLIPDWISGNHPGVAIRMSAHSVARELCTTFPLVSTSANLSGTEPTKDASVIEKQFSSMVPICKGELGESDQPSPVFDVLTGVRFR